MSNDLYTQREYLFQTVVQAANLLKLSAEKIEMVGLLKDEISKTPDVETFVVQMKKITELAKLGLKLSDVLSFLKTNKIEYLNISEKFKQHSFNIVKELSVVLDTSNISSFRSNFTRIRETIQAAEPVNTDNSHDEAQQAMQRENYILHEENETEPIPFYRFEEIITKPISSLDGLLKRTLQGSGYKSEEFLYFANLMKKNWSVSKNFDSQIISNMHEVVSKTLYLLNSDALQLNKEIIDSLRACLIVIVALIKNKEIDITGYLKKAEDLGNSIRTIKVKEF